MRIVVAVGRFSPGEKHRDFLRTLLMTVMGALREKDQNGISHNQLPIGDRYDSPPHPFRFAWLPAAGQPRF
jgi:hypothetical protein